MHNPDDKPLIDEDSNTKTFDLKDVVVLKMDGVPDSCGDIINPDCKIEYQNPVPVYDGFPEKVEKPSKTESNCIGFADLRREGDKLVANIFLKKDCAKRLDIESRESRISIGCGYTMGKGSK